MGFNQCYLPSVETMKFQIQRDGLEKFIKLYRKYDAISGETDRMQFLEQKIFEYENNINSDTVVTNSNGM